MLRVSQEAVEVVRKSTTANLRVTAYAAEVLRRPAAPRVCVSQIAVEILRANAAIPSSNNQQPLIIIVAG
ncbi:MAG: hypothetical protein PHS57_09830 [Alphaproteobacteria bacterium]|nr:hypothetical protein [Alphaproteobacteria bacterium]